MSDNNIWQDIKLGEIGKFSTSSVDKKVVEGQAKVNLINYMDVYGGNTINADTNFMKVTVSVVEKARSQVLPGDILFTPSSETPDDIGYSAVVAEKLTDTLHSYHTVRLRPYSNNILDIRFSAWFANAAQVRKQFSQKCAGSTRYILSIPSFNSVICKIPKSLIEQRKIAICLDTMQGTIEKTEALIHKYQQVKSGLMNDLFTRGLTADGKLRPPREQAPELYQETPIGWIPKEWEAKELRNACDWYSGGTPSRMNHQWWEGKVPWLSPKDMKFFDLEDTEEHVTKSAAIFGSRLMPAGTVFIVIRGMILAHTFPVVYSSSEFCFNQDIKAVTGRDELHNRFLAYWFDANRDVFLKKTTEATHGTKRFDMKDLYDLTIGIPSPDEQQRILNRLEVISSRLAKEEMYVSKLRKLKFGLMHDLLTGKVPVTIDPTETAHDS
jgi:type I restriction enzyme S subunit